MKKCVGPDSQRPERRKRGGPVVCKATPGPFPLLHEIYCEVMATVILMTRGNAFAKRVTTSVCLCFFANNIRVSVLVSSDSWDCF